MLHQTGLHYTVVPDQVSTAAGLRSQSGGAGIEKELVFGAGQGLGGLKREIKKMEIDVRCTCTIQGSP